MSAIKYGVIIVKEIIIKHLFNIKQVFNFAAFMTKKEQILETALGLFGRNGYEATSIRDLSAEAGINVAMINYYFGSKEKLFEQVIEYKAAYLRNIFMELEKDTVLDPMKKIEAIVDYFVDRVFSSPSFYHLIHRELTLSQRADLQERIVDILLKNAFIIRDIINDGIKKNVFATVDAELTVTTLIGSVSQLMLSENMSRKMFKKNKDFKPYTDKNFNKRVKDHLKSLMASFLVKKK